MYENWLKEQLASSPHGTKKILAEHMGLDSPKLSKTLGGARELTARELERAVDFFGRVPEGFRSAGSDKSGPVILKGGRVPYAGVVAAGEFRAVDEYFDQDAGDHLVPASVTPHPGYPTLQQMAWLVRGDSMDEVDIRDGMWAVGASYADYVDKIGELDNGNYVVVERTRHGASERELTVKEVQFSRRGMRLIPRSSNTKHKEFFIPLDEEADPDKEQIQVLAVVLWVGRDFDPRSRK